MEYLPLIIYAVTFFIVPTVGAIVFGWFWRHQRARVRRSRYGDRMRETQRQLPL
jgi:Na+/proline symporter